MDRGSARHDDVVVVRHWQLSGRLARLARKPRWDAYIAMLPLMGVASRPRFSCFASIPMVLVRVPDTSVADFSAAIHRAPRRRSTHDLFLDADGARHPPRFVDHSCRHRRLGFGYARHDGHQRMGEDYVTFAEAKGLRASTIFPRYCARNAIPPQTTALALALG